MPPQVAIGLTERPNSGGAKVPPAPPLKTALNHEEVPFVCHFIKKFDALFFTAVLPW